MLQYAVRCCAVRKTFHSGKRSVQALAGVNLDVRPGEMVALIGASGSGKSTLLRHLSGLAVTDPAGGRIEVLEQVVQDNGKLTGSLRILRRRIGFVFQQFNLVGRLSLITNVLVGMVGGTPSWRSLLMWYSVADRRRAMEALARVGMADYAGQRASTLSGGQQQRAAIARALVQGAEVILADEPIASLDPVSARAVMDTLARINREDRVTVVVTLHQVEYARQYCQRTVALRHGHVVFDGPSRELTPALLQDIYGAELTEAQGEPTAPAEAELKTKPATPVLQPV